MLQILNMEPPKLCITETTPKVTCVGFNEQCGIFFSRPVELIKTFYTAQSNRDEVAQFKTLCAYIQIEFYGELF